MIGARSLSLLVLPAFVVLGGCAIGKLIGGMAQNYEYSKLIEVHPAYAGLENKTTAVLVDVDMATQFEHPDVQFTIAANVAKRLQENVPGIRVAPPYVVREWQFQTPQWSAMPYGQIAEQLRVERLVYIDVFEYRLHPEGNQWLWDGVCSAHVGVIEGDSFDPDTFIDMFTIEAAFPDMPGVTRESADARAIQIGVLNIFVRDASWLFFRHLEPKYPDKYNGPIEEGRFDDEA